MDLPSKPTTKTQRRTGTKRNLDTTGREHTAPNKTISIQGYNADLKHIPLIKHSIDKVSRDSLAEGNADMRRCPKRDADMSEPFLCSPVSVM